MKKEQFKKKIKELTDSQFLESIEKECIRLFDSGGVDTAKFVDDYELPKLAMVVALQNIAEQYKPPKGEFINSRQDIIDNLKHF